MKTPTALSVTSSQREQTSLRSQAPRLPRSNVCSTPDLENPSASVHRKRFSTPSLTLKFLCAGKLNPPYVNCWHMNEYESDAMWRLYSTANETICVQSTFKRLAEGLSSYVSAGEVNYI